MQGIGVACALGVGSVRRIWGFQFFSGSRAGFFMQGLGG